MKQRNVVSMLGALVLIISAVVLITGCPPANSNKGNTGNNSGNISNNGGNTGNNGSNTGNNGGNTGNNGGNTGNNGGNSGTTGNTDIVKKDIIEFETASVKCTNTNSYTKEVKYKKKINCCLKRFCLQVRLLSIGISMMLNRSIKLIQKCFIL